MLLGTRARWASPTLLSLATLLGGLYMTYEVNPLEGMGNLVTAKRAAKIRACLEVIPSDASVSATSALVPHLTHREKIYQLKDRADQEYKAADTTTSTWPLGGDEVLSMVEASLGRGYVVACSKRYTVVLKKVREASIVARQGV